jgi:hypothetical protein
MPLSNTDRDADLRTVLRGGRRRGFGGHGAGSSGFALKFYTEEGNWDMTINNTPVFFIRDPLKFGDRTTVRSGGGASVVSTANFAGLSFARRALT